MRFKGRSFAMGVAAVSLLSLLGAAIGMRHRAVEEWYRYQLRSEDDSVREAAARKLGELKCARAVPDLIHQIKESPGPENVFMDAVAGIGPSAVPFLSDALRDPKHLVRFVAALALKKIGPDAEEAVPALVAALRSNARERSILETRCGVTSLSDPLTSDLTRFWERAALKGGRPKSRISDRL
jgi:HEAT repeat protein